MNHRIWDLPVSFGRAGQITSKAIYGAPVIHALTKTFYKDAASHEHVVSIVGIDEVDLNRRYISWRSPLARAFMKSAVGDRVVLLAPTKTEHLEILDVEYAPITMDPFREPPGTEATPKL